MKVLGFDCTENNDPYFVYLNDGTKHRNKDYNELYPEPKGKIELACNLNYKPDEAFVDIKQDGGSRTVYNGVCPTEEFLESLLNNIR
jgi:hypothetical protein